MCKSKSIKKNTTIKMRILVPTDFSACSKNAVDAAILVAGKLDAEIHLFHCVDDFFPWSEISEDDKQESNTSYAMKQLKELESRISEASISSRSFISEGKFLNEVEKQVTGYDYGLIVMGSHGISGKSEWFIGSNTQKVIRKLNEKVLVVKNRIEDVVFERVLFVTSLDEEDLDPFRKLIEFITPFEVSQLHILTINTSGFFFPPSEEWKAKADSFVDIASDYNTVVNFQDDYSVDAGVRHYVVDKGIDLVSISNHSRHPVKRIFQGSNVEIMVNHSKRPVLTIDYKNK